LLTYTTHQYRNAARGAYNDYDNFLSGAWLKHFIPKNQSERVKAQTDRNNVGVLEQEIEHGFLRCYTNLSSEC
jgi:hypothetical protein